MADAYAQYQQPPRYFIPNIHRLGRGNSPPRPNDTPSPSQSPAPQSPASGLGNYLHLQPGQHNPMMSGGPNPGRLQHITSTFKYQQQAQQLHQQHLDHTPSHAQNGTVAGGIHHTFPTSGTPGVNTFGQSQNIPNGNSAQPAPHWAEQLQLCQQSRQNNTPHYYARAHASARGANGAGATAATSATASTTNRLARNEDDEGEKEKVKSKGKGEGLQQSWVALDFGGQGLRALSNSLFSYTFLDKLYINHNKLTKLPPATGRLKQLSFLDASGNALTELPIELGMLTSLRTLLLFDNRLQTLPPEMGTLYQLETLGIEGNPLQEGLKEIMVKEGTKALITYLRENCPVSLPPTARDWIVLNENDKQDNKDDRFSVLCYNILCDKYATQTMYGYTASWALSWDYRKDLILQELQSHNSDIICLQEVAMDNFNEVFSPSLAYHEYKGVFWPKSRAKTMSESEKKNVDGCATFFKTTKFNLIDKQVIDFSSSAIQREDMKKTADIFNRVMPKDNIAVVTFLENKATGYRVIVANVHITWDPAFKDVKLIQTAMLMEELTKIAETFAKNNPKPSSSDSGETPTVKYPSGPSIPVIICGDFNSTADSGVYELLARGSVTSDHGDLEGRMYGNFSKDGMSHPFSLKSSYGNIGELNFTNYTPTFTGVIDYIWYSTNSLQVSGLLGDVDKEYIERVAGFPNPHFPSDHIALFAEFQVKPQKNIVKPPPPDFGPNNSSSSRK